MTTRTRIQGAFMAAGLFTLSIGGTSLAAPSSHDHSSHGAALDRTSILQPAAPEKATRTVEVTLADLTVEPGTLAVKAGETVRFVVRNEGTLLHTFDLGTPDHQLEAQTHTGMMLDHGMITDTGVVKSMMTMDHGGHGDGHAAMATLLVEPGATEEVAWTFTEAGTLEFACSMPGHYEAGMAGSLNVSR